jgi:Hemolysin-coregulated protein (uncharacterized)
MKLSLLPLLFVVSAAALPAQQTIYLKLDTLNIPGTAAPHLNEVRVTSFESGQTAATALSTTAGSTAGKVSFQDMKIMTAFNPAVNAMLGLRMAMGSHFPNAELRFYNSLNQVTSKIQLGDVVVSGLKSSGADADVTQSIDLAFAKIRWWGGPTLAVISGWDLTKNVAW